MSTLSIAICTYNRSHYLSELLETLVVQYTSAAHRPEIIIIDNGSSDKTRATITYYANIIPITQAYLGKPCLSAARNLALKIARSDWVYFIDDDALPTPKWLDFISNFCAKISDYKIGIIGGNVLPQNPAAIPAWLPKEFYFCLSMVNFGETERQFGYNPGFVGANIGYRKNIALFSGGFNVNLGRQGNKLISGEESILVDHLIQLGYKCAFLPHADVYHPVPPERASLSFFTRRLYYEGYSCAYIDQLNSAVGIKKRYSLLKSIKYVSSPDKLINALLRHKNIDIGARLRFFRHLGYLWANTVPICLRDPKSSPV